MRALSSALRVQAKKSKLAHFNWSRVAFGKEPRLVEQKGIKLLLEVIPALAAMPRVQLVMLGHGDREIERALQETAARYSDRFALNISYDENLARLVLGAP